MKTVCSFDFVPARSGYPAGAWLTRHDNTVPPMLVHTCVSDEQAQWLANALNHALETAVETYIGAKA